MAFFEDLGKKITQASQSAVNKAKDVTDVAKYNSAISDEEKKISEYYTQLGKLYMAKFSEAPEPVLAQIVGAIKDSEKKIVEYRELIKEIRGIVKCEKCGSDVPTNQPFCGNCGTSMAKQPAPSDTVSCRNCGNSIPNTAKFCRYCGQAVSAPAVQAQPAVTQTPEPVQPAATQTPEPVQPVTPEPEQVKPAARICGNCGAVLEDYMSFCTKCGTKVQ